MSSLSLAFEANALLDDIDEKGPDEFSLSRLEELRAQMLIAGLNAPFSSVLAATKSEADDWSPQEAEDARKQVGNMRYIASMKKFTLNRVRVAIAASKIAKTLGKINDGKLAGHLPLGGSYRKALVSHGYAGADSYHKLMSSFSIHSFDVQGASAVISLDDGAGERVQRTVELSGAEGADEKIRGIFGPDAKLEKVQKKTKKAGLIRNYSAKVALFVAAAVFGATEAKEAMEKSKADEKVAAYNLFLNRHGLSADADLSEAEGLERVKEHAVKEGHLKLVKGELMIDEEFAAKLAKRRRERKKMAEKEACDAVLSVLLRQYVAMNEAGRLADGMPSMMISPDERQLAVLAHIAPANYPVAHLPKVIAEKVGFEKRAPPLAPAVWGAAFVCARANVDAKWAAQEFGLNEMEIGGAVSIMRDLMSRPSGRGAKFLEGARKK